MLLLILINISNNNKTIYVGKIAEDVLVRPDFSNTFNCLHRDVVLQVVADELQRLYRIFSSRLKHWDKTTIQ